MKNTFKADLRDANFVLWEQLRLADSVLTLPGFERFSKADLTELLMQARDFACQELGPLCQSADDEGCTLQDGRIRVPYGFPQAAARFLAAGWGRIGMPVAEGGGGVPYISVIAAHELFSGANLAFMSYGAFAFGAYVLTKKYGSKQLQSIFCDKFAQNRWYACLCMTEPQAGTDVGSIASSARRLDNGLYAIRGRKTLISAGSDDMAENQVYLMLARAEGSPPGTQGVSCFLVPKYRIGADGEVFGDNFVRVLRLEEKMGLRGSATAELSFGEEGECQGYLLGDRPNFGLSQLMTTMNQARVGTGLFALGVSSSAYLHAAQYACSRIQGVDFRDVLNPIAPKVPIVAHADVRRMLLEMKCKVEGCRALIYRVALHHTKGTAAAVPGELVNEAEQARHEALVSFLSPIVKAYTTDQAWRICELAIQIHGGRGYTRDLPLEQYARDIKVLSIWEGTNYVQSADLLVSRIGLGRTSPLLKVFVAEVGRLLDTEMPNAYRPMQQRLQDALNALVETHALLSGLMQTRKMELVLLNATRFLQMAAHVALGWLLLEAAMIAARTLESIGSDHSDTPFYEGKVQSAKFFFVNFLSTVVQDAARIAEQDSSALDVDVAVFDGGATYEDFTI